MASDKFSELERLWALKESGALSEEEFLRLKAKALDPSLGAISDQPHDRVTDVPLGTSELQTRPSNRISTAKGCWIAIGIGFLFLLIIALAAPADQKNSSVQAETPAATLLTDEQKKVERQRKLNQVAQLQTQAAAVPAFDYAENERIYGRLAQLDPDNPDFAQKRDEYANKRRLAETYSSNPERALKITRFNWTKGGFGSIQLVALTVKNDAAFPIRDFELKCVHQGPSGTDMDMNTRTVYELIPAHSSKRIPEVNMGFINAQVASSRCEITDAIAG